MYDAFLIPKTLHRAAPSFAGAFCTLLCAASIAAAQAPPAHDPLQTFAPLTLPSPVNVYRSSNGAPGPQYWPNRADYEIHAAIEHTP